MWEPNVGDFHTWNDNVTVIGPEQFENITGYELRSKVKWGDREDFGQFIVGYHKEWVVMNFKTIGSPPCEDIINMFQLTYKTHANTLWLPRQDQLQDILRKRIFTNTSMPMLAGKFWSWISHTNPILQSSMEILWLSFLMYMIFSKSWDGKKWI